jgi:hypothetical protein
VKHSFTSKLTTAPIVEQAKGTRSYYTDESPSKDDGAQVVCLRRTLDNDWFNAL